MVLVILFGQEAQAWALLREDLRQAKSVKDRVPMKDAGLLWVLPTQQVQVQVQVLWKAQLRGWRSVVKEQKRVAEQMKGLSAWRSVYYGKRQD